MNKTLGDLVAFVLKYRKGKAFHGYAEQDIANTIQQAAEDGILYYSTDSDNNLIGIICATKDDERKVVHVNDVLTLQRWVLAEFMATFKSQCPDYRLTSQRWRGQDRKKPQFMDYDTNRLLHLLKLKEAK